MSVLLNRNTTCTTSGGGTPYFSGAEFNPDFRRVRAAQSLIFYVLFCRSLYVLLFVFAILLFVVL